MAPTTTTTQAPNIFEDTPRVPTKPSVLRAILSSKTHKRNPTADDVIPPPQPSMYSRDQTSSIPAQFPLGERAPNRDVADGQPPSTKPTTKDEKQGLHKKTKSAVSLKSLRNYMERKDNRPEESPEEESGELKPKKVKSANSLTAILKRSQRGRKGGDAKEARDKENRSPTDLSDNIPDSSWVQYPVRPSEGRSSPRRLLEKRRTFEEEVSLYTPKGYSPAQQRNFYDYHQPSLTRRTGLKPRPKSDCLSGDRNVKDFAMPLNRTPSDKGPVEVQENQHISSHRRPRGLSRPGSYSDEQKRDTNPKPMSRVQAAISAFNAKSQESELQKRLDSKDLESEFEKLLVSRIGFLSWSELIVGRMRGTFLTTCGTR